MLHRSALSQECQVLSQMDHLRVPQHEVWPVDEPSHYVGASTISTSHLPKSHITTSRRFQRIASLNGDFSEPAPSTRSSRRSITSIEDPSKGIVQGFCRMSWFVGLKCTRFLRLAGRTLECFDGSLRKRLWVVLVDGARVRISMQGRKIVLSKLPVGVVEFVVSDDKSCRQWAAALLRASALASTEYEVY